MKLPFARSAQVRVIPFFVFMLLLALRGLVPLDGSWGFDPRWIYAATVVAVTGLLAWWWSEYGELARETWPTLREAAIAVAVGVLVFGLWIHLDAPWMTLTVGAVGPFVPVTEQGAIDWPLVVVRWLGATLMVPVMEELFWRSFLMRWVQHPAFEALDPQRVGLRAVVLSTFVFVLAHPLWLAATVAGLAYAWLYVRTGRLWVPVIAHAVTNGLLGVWVVATGNWQFW